MCSSEVDGVSEQPENKRDKNARHSQLWEEMTISPGRGLRFDDDIFTIKYHITFFVEDTAICGEFVFHGLAEG